MDFQIIYRIIWVWASGMAFPGIYFEVGRSGFLNDNV